MSTLKIDRLTDISTCPDQLESFPDLNYCSLANRSFVDLPEITYFNISRYEINENFIPKENFHSNIYI